MAMGSIAVKRRWIAVVLGFGLAVGLITVYLKGREPAPRVETVPMVESPGQMVLTNIEFNELEQEKRRWTLKAAQARYFQEGQKTELEDVHLALYLKSGDEVELRSQTGVLHAGSKDIELTGQVHALIAQSYQVDTDCASYSHQERKVSCDSAIHVDGPELVLDGGRWQFMLDQQQAVVDGGIKARIIFTPRILGNGMDPNHGDQKK
ncbi:MAG TPA: LPS export ABC transporter periplasmic protein LptC [Syntrophobacteraceae bacterium]|nr:LPS export ABC transporter periplasmic protein LptC [Syntrophobacteraceae bacterium]